MIQLSNAVTIEPDYITALRELFPCCAQCGRLIRVGERVTPCDDGRNRVRCESCSARASEGQAA